MTTLGARAGDCLESRPVLWIWVGCSRRERLGAFQVNGFDMTDTGKFAVTIRRAREELEPVERIPPLRPHGRLGSCHRFRQNRLRVGNAIRGVRVESAPLFRRVVSLVARVPVIRGGETQNPHEPIRLSIHPRSDNLEAELLTKRNDRSSPTGEPLVHPSGVNLVDSNLHDHARNFPEIPATGRREAVPILVACVPRGPIYSADGGAVLRIELRRRAVGKVPGPGFEPGNSYESRS